MILQELKQFLVEGGAATNSDRINVQYIKPTFDRYKRIIKKIDPQAKYKTIGSLGKKEDSGDIDVAIQSKFDIDYFDQALTKLGIEHKVNKGLYQINTKFPIYDKSGKKTGKFVQVDLMFGDVDFLSKTYWAPGKSQSKFIGADLTVFFRAITRFTPVKKIKKEENKQAWKEIKQEHPDATLAYVYDLNNGIFLKARWNEVLTKGKNKGKLKEKSKKLPKPEYSTIKEIVELFNTDSKLKWTEDDFEKPLEKLWIKAKKSFRGDKIRNIIKYTEPALGERGPLKEMKFFENMGKQLFEAEKKEIKKILRDNLKELGIKEKKPGNRLKPDLRFDISGNVQMTTDILQNILTANGLENYTIEVIGPNENDDSKSGTYFTYWIKGDDVKISIVDSRKANSRVGAKSLAPNKILKTNYPYKSMELYKATVNEIKNIKLEKEIKKYLVYLLDQIKNNMEHLDYIPESGQFTVKKEPHEFNISDSEEKSIFNDFGEIISAFFLGRMTGKEIIFPEGSNNPIADFYIDDTPISAKNKSGAKASITGILDDDKLYNELLDNLGDKKEILEIIKNSTVLHSFLKLAKYYNTKSWEALTKRIGYIQLSDGSKSEQRKQDKVIKKQMTDWLDKFYSRDDKGNYHGTKEMLFKEIRKYITEVGIGYTMQLEKKYKPNSDKRFGVFIYPLYSEITKKLQSDNELTSKINKAINSMSAKQIHIYNKKNKIEFKLNTFKNATFKFDTGNISAWNSLNSNITFKIL